MSNILNEEFSFSELFTGKKSFAKGGKMASSLTNEERVILEKIDVLREKIKEVGPNPYKYEERQRLYEELSPLIEKYDKIPKEKLWALKPDISKGGEITESNIGRRIKKIADENITKEGVYETKKDVDVYIYKTPKITDKNVEVNDGYGTITIIPKSDLLLRAIDIPVGTWFENKETKARLKYRGINEDHPRSGSFSRWKIKLEDMYGNIYDAYWDVIRDEWKFIEPPKNLSVVKNLNIEKGYGKKNILSPEQMLDIMGYKKDSDIDYKIFLRKTEESDIQKLADYGIKDAVHYDEKWVTKPSWTAIYWRRKYLIKKLVYDYVKNNKLNIYGIDDVIDYESNERSNFNKDTIKQAKEVMRGVYKSIKYKSSDITYIYFLSDFKNDQIDVAVGYVDGREDIFTINVTVEGEWQGDYHKATLYQPAEEPEYEYSYHLDEYATKISGEEKEEVILDYEVYTKIDKLIEKDLEKGVSEGRSSVFYYHSSPDDRYADDRYAKGGDTEKIEPKQWKPLSNQTLMEKTAFLLAIATDEEKAEVFDMTVEEFNKEVQDNVEKMILMGMSIVEKNKSIDMEGLLDKLKMQFELQK